MRTVPLVNKVGREQDISLHTDVNSCLSKFGKFLDAVDLGS
jgi:hypothetical protein